MYEKWLFGEVVSSIDWGCPINTLDLIAFRILALEVANISQGEKCNA